MKNILTLLFFLVLTGCKTTEDVPETVSSVDLQRYSGKWYEIALYPNRFEKGCECTSAEYQLTDKGYFRIINRCYEPEKAKWKKSKGKAFPVDGSQNAKLKVQFFWPFKGDYWIIDLAPDYSWAVISESRREYLWILSRGKTIPEDTYQHILASLQQKGFDINKLEKTAHSCDTISSK